MAITWKRTWSKAYVRRKSKKKRKTYSSRDSHVVTHRSTNLPFNCLCMAERTGCPVFSWLWPYVLDLLSCRNLISWWESCSMTGIEAEHCWDPYHVANTLSRLPSNHECHSKPSIGSKLPTNLVRFSHDKPSSIIYQTAPQATSRAHSVSIFLHIWTQFKAAHHFRLPSLWILDFHHTTKSSIKITKCANAIHVHYHHAAKNPTHQILKTLNQTREEIATPLLTRMLTMKISVQSVIY
jgi:hypothetical protein